MKLEALPSKCIRVRFRKISLKVELEGTARKTLEQFLISSTQKFPEIGTMADYFWDGKFQRLAARKS